VPPPLGELHPKPSRATTAYALMADYFGLDAIAKRMDSHPSTVRVWHKSKNFLMYHRWNKKTQRYVWYTNDNLIHSWELARCTIESRAPKPTDQRGP
jgi:hypothetical protein